MGFQFEKTDKTIAACPICKQRPRLHEKITATGRQVFKYYCSNHPNIKAISETSKGARLNWLKAVSRNRNFKKKSTKKKQGEKEADWKTPKKEG